MTVERLCILFLTLIACMKEHQKCSCEARNIYDPCSDPDVVGIYTGLKEISKREVNPRNINGMPSIIQGTKILVSETIDYVTRLQRMHVDNTCVNSDEREDNMFARIRSCVVYDRIMTFNMSLFNDEYNITEGFNKMYVAEVTGQASTAAVLALILNRSENEYPYKQMYRRVMDNIFDILCAISVFWTGEEQDVLDTVFSFGRGVVRRVATPIDPTDSLLLLRAVEIRLQNIYETSLSV